MSIVRANVLTVFNLILAGFGIVTLIFGDPRDALFLGIIVANSGIGANGRSVRGHLPSGDAAGGRHSLGLERPGG